MEIVRLALTSDRDISLSSELFREDSMDTLYHFDISSDILVCLKSFREISDVDPSQAFYQYNVLRIPDRVRTSLTTRLNDLEPGLSNVKPWIRKISLVPQSIYRLKLEDAALSINSKPARWCAYETKTLVALFPSLNDIRVTLLVRRDDVYFESFSRVWGQRVMSIILKWTRHFNHKIRDHFPERTCRIRVEVVNVPSDARCKAEMMTARLIEEEAVYVLHSTRTHHPVAFEPKVEKKLIERAIYAQEDHS